MVFGRRPKKGRKPCAAILSQKKWDAILVRKVVFVVFFIIVQPGLPVFQKIGF